MSLVKYDHIHRYRAINEDRRMYKCQVEGCRHTINASIMEGRIACCPKCESEVKITSEHLRRRVIACIGCGNSNLVKQKTKPMDITGLLDRARSGI